MADTAPEALTPAASPTPAEALTQIVKILELLKPEDRRRTVNGAMAFFDEQAGPTHVERASTERKVATPSADADEGGYSATAIRWMAQYDVSPEQLDRAFHFPGDGTFAIHDVPGKSKKEQTLNIYVLAGLGKFLSSGDRSFDDALARGFCEKFGCYDKANHAKHLKEHRNGEFSGDKNKGYTLTSGGTKRGAALVKELSGAAE